VGNFRSVAPPFTNSKVITSRRLDPKPLVPTCHQVTEERETRLNDNKDKNDNKEFPDQDAKAQDYSKDLTQMIPCSNDSRNLKVGSVIRERFALQAKSQKDPRSTSEKRTASCGRSPVSSSRLYIEQYHFRSARNAIGECNPTGSTNARHTIATRL
jgi:hypothetical protein